MLFAGNFILQSGIAASLLSLDAVDFGLIVDSSVIIVENYVRIVAKSRGSTRSAMLFSKSASPPCSAS